MTEPAERLEERRAVLAILARAGVGELSAAWDGLSDKPEVHTLREPECGLVMARGRIGGGGQPFNLGEVTVTRATVRLSTGEVGVGHVLGRDRRQALMVARFDALWQSAAYRPMVEEAVLQPIRRRTAEEDADAGARAAATRVNFFTMVRGEDP